MSNQQQDSSIVQRFQLCNNLLNQAIGAVNKNRLKRAEKLIQETVKVVEDLRRRQAELPDDQNSIELAQAIEALYERVLERRDWFVTFREQL